MFNRLPFFCAAVVIGSAFWPGFLSAQMGSDSFVITTQVGENTEPPTVPDPVTATPIADTQINVEWGASSDPFGVAGYQVFRDGLQIATTSATLYEDIGLQASTTYSYFIRAFDGAGNISSSSVTVSTTTLATIVPPTVDPESEQVRQSGRAPDPELVSYQLVPGAVSARMTFGTNVPTRYIIRYGRTGEFELGTIETEVFRRLHSTILTGLEPGTTYEYELLVWDAYQQREIVRRASFTTEQRFPVRGVPNVLSLQAIPISSDVLLSWRMPQADAIANVQVVRNHRFFPQDPFDGEVVYTGQGTSFTDVGALADRDRQYYTVFVLDLSGNYSSGAVAIAERLAEDERDPSVVPPAIEPPITPTTTDLDTQPIGDLRFSDVQFIQDDQVVQPAVDSVELSIRSPFLLRIPVAQTPPHLKIITVTITRPEGRPAQDTYLLRRDQAGVYYEALVDRLSIAGEHRLLLSIYDLQDEIQYQLSGTIDATDTHEVPVETETWYVPLVYWGGGSLVIALVLLWLWRIFFLFRRQHETKA